MFHVYRMVGAIGLAAACLNAMWSQPTLAGTVPRSNVIS